MKYFKPLLLFILAIALLLYSATFYQLTLINGILQIILFLLVVNIPAWVTKRMSYVDIAWPRSSPYWGSRIYFWGRCLFKKNLGRCAFCIYGVKNGAHGSLLLVERISK
jgi:hypothetical protein